MQFTVAIAGMLVQDNHFVLRRVEDMSLYVWGNNVYGQLGIGSLDEVFVPTRVVIDSELQASHIVISKFLIHR